MLIFIALYRHFWEGEMRFFVAVLSLLGGLLIANPSSAITISPSQALAINASAGSGFGGINPFFSTSTDVQANQLRLDVYSGHNLTGSLIGTTILPFGFSATGGGGAFIYAPDADGDVTVVASAQFGTIDLSFNNNFQTLACTGSQASTCSPVFNFGNPSAVQYTVANPLAPVPLPPAGFLLLVALGSLGLIAQRMAHGRRDYEPV
ncbi:hypothetical protein [Ruegeria sp. HKCCA4008]|uniref:hypothetical protein n=1 Tax=Ruegeria sp. HKCCA4008 TaxID=2682999 RepID=UPI0014879920|nr:hypothetical protein [Ruegeria sp. HKCCA4008]